MFKRVHIRKSGISLPDLLAFAVILAAFAAVFTVAGYWSGPLEPPAPVDLSLSSLPYALFLSLSRITIAYLICLVSGLAVGYWAAHSRFAEKIIIPLVDIGQSIPVLGFLPGFVAAFLAIFPDSRVGLELAAVLTLYTGMAWNLMLSFYSSIKTIPRDYVDIIKAYGYGPLGIFLRLEIPYSMSGIVWNSMLSVAGGWFFLTVCESYTLGDKSFNLVGLGSFMSLAATRHDFLALTAGGLSMVVILVLTDYFIWNPLLRWAERFQRLTTMEEEEENEPVLNFFTKSKRLTNFVRSFRRRYAAGFYVNQKRGRRKRTRPVRWDRYGYVLFAGFVALCGWGSYQALLLMGSIPSTEWFVLVKNTGFTLLRVCVVLLLSGIIMVPFGLWLGAQTKLVKRAQPIIQVIAAFPAPMIFPLLMPIFTMISLPMSVGSVVLMMFGAQWYLLFNVISGAAGVPENLVEVARVSGMSTWQTIRRVYLPATFPQILTGFITAAGGAWNVSVVAELVYYGKERFITPGLGSYITEAAVQAKYPELAAAVTIMVVVIVLLNRFFWARLYNLAESKYRLG
jgi:NitT/TauT family transport system permease protein